MASSNDGFDDHDTNVNHQHNHGNNNFNINGSNLNHNNFNLGRGPEFVQPLDVERSQHESLYFRPRALITVGAISFLLTAIGTAASLYGMIFGTIPTTLLTWLGAFVGAMPLFVRILLLILGALVLALGMQLARQRFANFGRIVLECDDDGIIWFSTLAAPCPKCPGELRLNNGPKHDPGTHFTCSRNPQHTWRFDYTTLRPAGRQKGHSEISRAD